MTDEERQKLCDKLRYPLKEWSAKKLWDEACLPAADEIERLQRELNSTLGLLYQESERQRYKQLIANLEAETSEQADEIERLAAELDETRKKLTMTEIQRDDLGGREHPSRR